MKAAALLLACIGALTQAPAKSDLTYTVGKGPNAVTRRISSKGEHPDASYRLGFDGIPSQIRNLPVWLPPELRKLGSVVYDDGQGFAYDKGEEIYILQLQEKWKGFDTLGLSYWYQGMQQQDNWRLEARYDEASGLLLTATVRTRFGRGTRVTFELALTSASDPALRKKLAS